ncbi:hypothetical protein FNV43_RR07900 [Rhamnella rubrinervis]|uniref:Transcription initiation factor IIF subunit alpha n=1 Tax=Rhamnella rubrinervis TaxID=2594499 RepID=A0A8K0MMV4_9ROSA|nr:hypothetical protein FNV43_RR07900 [Rhamnella rubrinervis]
MFMELKWIGRHLKQVGDVAAYIFHLGFSKSWRRSLITLARELRRVRGFGEGRSHTTDKDPSAEALCASMTILEKRELRQVLAENESGASSKGTSSSTGTVTEEEIRAVLMQKTPVTTQDLVGKFKARQRSAEISFAGESKNAFVEALRKNIKIQKTNGSNYVVLRNK